MIVAQITLLKFAWTLVSLIGVVVTSVLLSMAITDYKLLRTNKLNGWRKQVAKTSILIFLGGFGTQCVYFVAGVLALTQSNSRGSSQLIRQITQALFLFGAITAILLAIVIFYRRRRILEIIEEGIRKENNSGNT